MAEFDIEHQGVDTLGQFLTEDTRADQRDTFDRRSHIAQRIEFPVGGHHVIGLADHGLVDGLELTAVFRVAK